MEVSPNKDEIIARLEKQVAKFEGLLHSMGAGWWSINFTAQIYDSCESLRELCGFSKDQVITFEMFRGLIHPDHKDRVLYNALMFRERGFYEELFPIKTIHGYVWVRSKLGGKEVNEKGEIVATGYVQIVEEEEVKQSSEDQAKLQLQQLLKRHVEVSASLLRLLCFSDIQAVTLETLNDLLEQFNGDRAYIFEFDYEEQTHSCTYEVVRDKIHSEQPQLQRMPMSDIPWWTGQITNNIPIILNNIADLPPEATVEYEVLSSQGIVSLMVVPLVSKDGVWGYLGIDIVDKVRMWNSMDQQWFLGLANIISICMELRKSAETAKKEKEYFSNLYSHMPQGFVRIKLLFDAQKRPVDYFFLEMNPAVETIIGRPTSDYIGKSASELGMKIEIDLLEQLYEEVANNQSCRKAYERGGRIYDAVVYSSEPDEITVIFYDNTNAILATKALQHSEQTLRNIYKNIPVGIEIYDKNGYLVDINDMEQEIFGLRSKQDALGINLFENPNIPKEYNEVLRAGNPVEYDLEYSFSNVNHAKYYETNQADGYKNLKVRGTVLYDMNNEIENYLLIVIDNTESLRSYRQIQEFELLFNSIAEFARIGLSRWNPLKSTFTATDQWYKNLGQEVRPLQHITDAYTNMDPDDYARITEYFNSAVTNEHASFQGEVRVKENGEWRWLRFLSQVKEFDPARNNVEILGLNIDVTELKNTELKLIEAKTKAEESDRLKSAFLANVSHEIRTPLNAIVGFSDLLINTEDKQDKEEYMSIIYKNTDLLLQLISDILDISKIESGTVETVLEEVEVNQICRDLVQSQMVKAQTNVDLIFEEHEEMCRINTDRTRLAQVLSNLIGNALKFTSEGSVRIGYQVHKDEIAFYVRDTGVGIPPGQTDEIFERFVKLNSFVTGTGLGLAICRSIVEKLGGRIWVESEEGKGSCFRFTLPYKNEYNNLESTNMIEKEVTIKDVDMSTNEKPLILVAEDTDSNYLLISTILKKEYDLVRAYDGLQAVSMFSEHRPALVLMDIKMPNMDGMEATREIRKFDTETPIIALTAFAFDSDKLKAFEAGCSEYMTKPVNPTALREMLKRMLNR